MFGVDDMLFFRPLHLPLALHILDTCNNVLGFQYALSPQIDFCHPVSNVVYIPEVSYVEGRDVRDRVEEINYATQMLQELRAARLGITHEELLSRNSQSSKNRPVTMSFSDRKKIENLNKVNWIVETY